MKYWLVRFSYSVEGGRSGLRHVDYEYCVGIHPTLFFARRRLESGRDWAYRIEGFDALDADVYACAAAEDAVARFLETFSAEADDLIDVGAALTNARRLFIQGDAFEGYVEITRARDAEYVAEQAREPADRVDVVTLLHDEIVAILTSAGVRLYPDLAPGMRLFSRHGAALIESVDDGILIDAEGALALLRARKRDPELTFAQDLSQGGVGDMWRWFETESCLTEYFFAVEDSKGRRWRLAQS